MLAQIRVRPGDGGDLGDAQLVGFLDMVVSGAYIRRATSDHASGRGIHDLEVAGLSWSYRVFRRTEAPSDL